MARDMAQVVLVELAETMASRYERRGSERVSLKRGLHLTGGEPFLNVPLLIDIVRLANDLGLPGLFVETNAFWCQRADDSRQLLLRLREAGLQGILISANPFVLETVPFARTRRAVSLAREIFCEGAMVYQIHYYRQFVRWGLTDRLSLQDYLARSPRGLDQAELLLNGRAPYALGTLHQRYPAERFFGQSCEADMLRDRHMHIDSYGNYVPGYCGGLSLGDARRLRALCQDGIDLDARPVLAALLHDLENLYALGLGQGYEPQSGYVSKCHLCADIRRHLADAGDYVELVPRRYY